LVKLLVVGHITIDHISLTSPPLNDLISIGGPPSYAGLMAKRLGVEVDAATKVGLDFPDYYTLFLTKYINILKPAISQKKPTTRFQIQQYGSGRSLRLISRCEDIEEGQLQAEKYDLCILSPVAGEVSKEVATAARRAAKYLFLDPQGFLRRFDSEGFCTLSDMDKGLLKEVDVLKVDYEEMRSITGSDDLKQALNELHNLGPQVVILTSHSGYVTLSVERKIYKVPIPPVKIVGDTTGAGDILAGAFAASFTQKEDLLWAVCVGVSAATLAIQGVGISKIPPREEVYGLAGQILSGIESC
jgi:sugar/nucleoside kinase (ribokinase family)